MKKFIEKIRHIGFPHSYALMFILLIVAAVLTWVIPSGEFDTKSVTVDGNARDVVVPGTYHQIPKEGHTQSLWQVLEAPSNGIAAAVDVIAFVLILGGAFGIILKTGAIDRGLRALSDFLGSKGILVIPLMMILVSLGGSTYGMSEELIPLFIIFITFMLSQGFDSLTAILTLFLASQAGYIGSTINPFNVLIAQGIGGIHGNPLLWMRMVCWVIITAISIAFTMHHAMKVRKNPESSIVYDTDQALRAKLSDHGTNKNGELSSDNDEFTTNDKIIIAIFVAGLVLMVYGILAQGWYMTEISALFLAMGIIIGFVARFKVNEICDSFVAGCADFVYAAVIIALARGILVLMENGAIIDTILNALAGALGGLPKPLFTTILLAVQSIITLFVPSSSGSAALTMPVMGTAGRPGEHQPRCHRTEQPVRQRLDEYHQPYRRRNARRTFGSRYRVRQVAENRQQDLRHPLRRRSSTALGRHTGDLASGGAARKVCTTKNVVHASHNTQSQHHADTL